MDILDRLAKSITFRHKYKYPKSFPGDGFLSDAGEHHKPRR